mgnify:FL=1|tara:strand:- start:1145 stop:1798 length:654 start_codon:yes stop_codon:yes gene_type:complete
MSLWGNTDAANNVPKQTDTTGYGGDTPQVTPNGQVYFANTAIGDYIDKAAIGIFGVSAAEQSSAEANVSTGDGSGIPAHAGWVLRKVGTGPITSITSNAFGHLVNSYINFSTGGGKSGTGQIHANARVYVNSTGAVVNVTIGNTAGNYANTPTIANIYSSLHFVQNTAPLTNKVVQGRANAVFTITVGGRAGRVQTETLVAMGSMVGDGSKEVFDKG